MAPLVSCIVPTKNRARFIPSVIAAFQSQTYPHKELVIVDHGEDDTERHIPSDPTIHYHRVTGIGLTTGVMRNYCVEKSHGDVICHFDSDDWSAPERVADQVSRLGTDYWLTGYRDVLFHHELGQAYHWSSQDTKWMVGTSFCYTKELWEKQRFRDKRIGEDFHFLKFARSMYLNKVIASTNRGMIVARLHNDHTCKKHPDRSTRYKPVSSLTLPAGYRACASI